MPEVLQGRRETDPLISRIESSLLELTRAYEASVNKETFADRYQDLQRRAEELLEKTNTVTDQDLGPAMMSVWQEADRLAKEIESAE